MASIGVARPAEIVGLLERDVGVVVEALEVVVVLLDRVGDEPLLLVRDAELLHRLAVVRIELDRLLIGLDRGLVVPDLHVLAAALEVPVLGALLELRERRDRNEEARGDHEGRDRAGAQRGKPADSSLQQLLHPGAATVQKSCREKPPGKWGETRCEIGESGSERDGVCTNRMPPHELFARLRARAFTR